MRTKDSTGKEFVLNQIHQTGGNMQGIPNSNFGATKGYMIDLGHKKTTTKASVFTHGPEKIRNGREIFHREFFLEGGTIRHGSGLFQRKAENWRQNVYVGGMRKGGTVKLWQCPNFFSEPLDTNCE